MASVRTQYKAIMLQCTSLYSIPLTLAVAQSATLQSESSKRMMLLALSSLFTASYLDMFATASYKR
jgi:hypothetical protein